MKKEIRLDHYIFNAYVSDGYLHGDNNSSDIIRYKIKLPNGIWKEHPSIKNSMVSSDGNLFRRNSIVTLTLDTKKNREYRLNKILNTQN